VRNKPDDVKTVQELLKKASARRKQAKFDPGTIDGKISRDASRSATISAIEAFQSLELKMSKPDLIVDAGKGTIKALSRFATGAAKPKGEIGDLQLRVDRFKQYPDSVVGRLYVNGKYVCFTLEEAWRDNQRSISCVPPGTYDAYLRYDSSKKNREWCFQLTNVPNRTAIQIHIGNSPGDTEGCILVGTTQKSDFVGNSTVAYQLLQDVVFGPGLTRADVRKLKPPHGKIRVNFVDPFVKMGK
jgi:hypothetical protein